MGTKPQRSAANWPEIRKFYEATARCDFSARQIARDHGITETAIRKKAKAEKWRRRDHALGDTGIVPSAKVSWRNREANAAHVRAPIRELVFRDAPRAHLPKDREAKAEALLDIMLHSAESLLCQLDDAIGNRDSLIDMIEEWNEDTGGKMTNKYAALYKAIDLNQLSRVLARTAGVVQFVLDQSRG